MGIGVPIAQFADGWWYPGPDSLLEVASDGATWTKTFNLNRRKIDGGAGDFLRVEPGVSHGRVRVTYRPEPDGLRVEVRAVAWATGLDQVVLLNEESASFDDYADSAGNRQGTAIGSREPVAGDWARFRSSALDLEWEMPAPPPGGHFFASRDSLAGGDEISGLDWQFGPDFASVSYTVTFKSPAKLD